MKLIVGVLLMLAVFSSHGIEFTTEHADKAELATVELLKALRQAHDTTKWEFTNKVHIKRRTIPHSHPVLTLNTRHTSKAHKDQLLSTYLHEQIHWHLSHNIENTRAAIAELKTIYKTVPVGFPTGARDERSTYLHLLVCHLEMAAVAELLSHQRVKALSHYWQQDHYTWIYTEVEKNKRVISKIIEKHGLTI